MKNMEFYPGFDIEPAFSPMGFSYGKDVFGPAVENRRLDDIRKSLMDPACSGPDTVYSIAMDTGKMCHKSVLEDMHLLYGAVVYASGRLGREPVRSQGHIHNRSRFSGWSTPEVYEIWTGEAIVYMQETAEDHPGRCFAVHAGPGDVVIVPPYWAHATVNASADENAPMAFGAWCVRDYGFEYDDVRAHNGIAWFPVFGKDGELEWLPNPKYAESELVCKSPDAHPELGIVPGEPIYTTFEKNHDAFAYVVHPELKAEVWKNYIP